MPVADQEVFLLYVSQVYIPKRCILIQVLYFLFQMRTSNVIEMHMHCSLMQILTLNLYTNWCTAVRIQSNPSVAWRGHAYALAF